MAAEDQPTQEFDINRGPADNLYEDFTLLRLDGFNSSCKTCSAAPDITRYHSHCSPCIFSGAPIPSSANTSPSSNKRRSPNYTSPAPDQIPKRPKKLFQEPLDSENNNVSAASAIPSLRRCNTSPPFAAHPYNNPPVVPAGKASATADNVHQSPPPPESVKIAEATASLTTPPSKGTASMPPKPPHFKRCSSDPSAMKSFSQSASNNALGVDGSPDYQRLKWMKNWTKEMSQWFDDFLPEETVAEEKEDKGTEEDNYPADIKEANNPVKEAEERVSVERTGESLIVHFKCPCSKGFQILLSGANCYYKLL